MKPVSVWTRGTRSGVGWNRFHYVVWTGLKSVNEFRVTSFQISIIVHEIIDQSKIRWRHIRYELPLRISQILWYVYSASNRIQMDKATFVIFYNTCYSYIPLKDSQLFLSDAESFTLEVSLSIQKVMNLGQHIIYSRN